MRSIQESMSRPALAAARVRAASPAFLQRECLALDEIRNFYALLTHPYVACSFGKDSAVVLHMTLAAGVGAPDVRFMRWPESDLLNNYEAVIAVWRERYPQMDLSILDMRREHLDDSAPGRWAALESLRPSDGYLIGLRKEESRGRRISLSRHGVTYQKRDGLWRCAPLADWKTEDITAYVVKHDLPMLDTYHRLGMAARTASRVPRHTVRGAMLADLRAADPRRFERLAEMFPEVQEWV